MTILLLLSFWLPQQPATFQAKDILVITSKDTPISQISITQLRQLYLKKIETLNHHRITPIQLKEAHPLRPVFDQMVLGSSFNAENYWLEQSFLANEKPPVSVTNEAFVLIFVQRNEGFIGYVNKALIGEVQRLGLKILKLRN